MLTLKTKLRVDEITGKQIFDFLANPTIRPTSSGGLAPIFGFTR
jgi:hypothetical protein